MDFSVFYLGPELVNKESKVTIFDIINSKVSGNPRCHTGRVPMGQCRIEANSSLDMHPLLTGDNSIQVEQNLIMMTNTYGKRGSLAVIPYSCKRNPMEIS